MPTTRSFVTVVSHPSSSLKTPAIAVCGGVANVAVVKTVEVYSHSTSQWHTAEPLPTPSWGLTSATVGDIAYLLGGMDADLSTSKCCYSVSLDFLWLPLLIRNTSCLSFSDVYGICADACMYNYMCVLCAVQCHADVLMLYMCANRGVCTFRGFPVLIEKHRAYV